MNTPASTSEPQSAGASGKRASKINKACVPCRIRKVKCDAAVIGLPCSSCTSRQCAEDCLLPDRKTRTRKIRYASPASNHGRITSRSSQLDGVDQSLQSDQSTSDPLDTQSPHQTEPDLLYLNILNDAVKDSACSSQAPGRPRPKDHSDPRSSSWTKLPQLDDIDNEYLIKKGVFDLPPLQYLDAFVKTYFERVHPFAPVLNRAEFIRDYQSGNCSLFVLRAILTSASLYVPVVVLSACGFASRSAAQESFFFKANLLHDFAAEDDTLLMLQGSIILCTVILDHPTDRDFGYWLHNAIRLATKLDLRGMCIREDRPHKALKLYRRIWWGLCFLDLFHVFVNPRHSRLLENVSSIKPRMEDDWNAEDLSGVSSGFLTPLTPQQKASPVVHCELSRIFGECLTIVTKTPQQDPRRMLQPLDMWRKSLATKLHVGENAGTDIYYLNIQAMGYRFECILCRLIRRTWQHSRHADWSEWARQRLRSAILELDTLAMRVLAIGFLENFPISFITTMTALLALHIESALDPSETDLVRSRARISINQTMLILYTGKEIPALKRALPVFENILTKKNLYLVPPSVSNRLLAPPQSQDHMEDVHTSSQAQDGGVSSHAAQWEYDPSFDVDFLGFDGFDFLDEWRQIGQMDYTGRY